MQIELNYDGAGVPVREDLQATQRELLEYLRAPGTWLTGAERIAVAAESRNAQDCPLCLERKQALSPEQVQGEHSTVSQLPASPLPASMVEVIHRVRGDSGRLSRRFYEQALESGVASEVYVEVVGVVTFLAGLDYFCRAAGIPAFDLPAPLPGEPSRHRPQGTQEGVAWVPMLMPQDAAGPESGLYPEGFVPNIAKALSLVPDHARMLQRLTETHYLGFAEMGDPTLGRDLDRLQIELVAARVSALNECFY